MPRRLMSASRVENLESREGTNLQRRRCEHRDVERWYRRRRKSASECLPFTMLSIAQSICVSQGSPGRRASDREKHCPAPAGTSSCPPCHSHNRLATMGLVRSLQPALLRARQEGRRRHRHPLLLRSLVVGVVGGFADVAVVVCARESCSASVVPAPTAAPALPPAAAAPAPSAPD